MYKTSEEQKIRLHEIVANMKKNGIDTTFIADAAGIGEIYEGVYDLFCLWEEEVDKNEKQKIIADLKNEIKEYKTQVEQK
jgi:hypothetical protein